MSKGTLTRNTELALKAPEGSTVPQSVWLPPSVRGKPPKVIQDIAVTRAVPSVQKNIIRISDETDPIGLLMAIANGQPVATFSITEEGEVEIHYETLTLEKRLSVIKFLADKVLPKMSMVVTKSEKVDNNDAWMATIETAAGKA